MTIKGLFRGHSPQGTERTGQGNTILQVGRGDLSVWVCVQAERRTHLQGLSEGMEGARTRERDSMRKVPVMGVWSSWPPLLTRT